MVTTSKCFRLYGQLLVKKRILLLHILFLTRCNRKDLTSKFINVKTSTTSEASEKAAKSAKKIWLVEEIKFKHKQLSKVEEQLYPLHLQLLQQGNYHTAAECVVRRCVEEKKMCWQEELCKVHRSLFKRVQKIKQKHHKKLLSLERTQHPVKAKSSVQPIENFVINLSSTVFSQAELNLLNKGLNFAVSSPCAPLADIVSNVENAIQYNDFSFKSAVRYDMKQCLLHTANRKNSSKSATKFEDWCTIRQLKARDVVYSRADKGNAVVIMEKADYDSRVLDMIRSGPYVECVYKNGKPKDPLNAMIEGANNTRQKVTHLMGEEKLERKFLVPTQKLPRYIAYQKYTKTRWQCVRSRLTFPHPQKKWQRG